MEINDDFILKLKVQIIWRISFYYEFTIKKLFQKWIYGKKY